jgi:YHS domain-containing protein
VLAALAAGLAAALPTPLAAPAQQPLKPEAVEILDGVDPVLLLAGKEIPGKPELSVEHDGYRYLFASPETKAQFDRDRSRYEPAFGGSCARMGARTPGNPQLFAVHDGRIYLFGGEGCLRAFQSAPARYLDAPPSTPSYSQRALARGAELLDAAARAAGGPALDALRGWRVELVRQRVTPRGTSSATQIQAVLLPDSIRDERRAAFGTVIEVSSPRETFGFFVRPDGRASADQRAPRQRRALREGMRRDLSRTLLWLLRERRGEGVVAGWLASDRVGGTPVEVVAIHRRESASALHIAPASGRILKQVYRERGPDGGYGEIGLEFSDYRAVGGLTLPFAVSASFDGSPVPELGYAVTAWTFEPAPDPALFEPTLPKSGGRN